LGKDKIYPVIRFLSFIKSGNLMMKLFEIAYHFNVLLLVIHKNQT